MGQQRRYFQRHPAIHAVRLVADGSKQVGGPRDVFERQLEEDLLADLLGLAFLADRRIVRGLFLMAWSKIVGFEVSPVTDSSSM